MKTKITYICEHCEKEMDGSYAMNQHEILCVEASKKRTCKDCLYCKMHFDTPEYICDNGIHEVNHKAIYNNELKCDRWKTKY
jgi:hypothetical protein